MTQAIFPDLKGTSVFITGGGSGIGAALTEGFLRQGAKVAFCQRSDASAFVDDMEARTGNRPLFLKCDLTDTDQLAATLQAAADAHGPVTVLVNNAANDQRHGLHDWTDDKGQKHPVDSAFFDWMVAINLKCYFFAVQQVAPGMKAAGGGSIINFSSISYMMGNAGYAIYTGCNSAINGMSRCLAREMGGDRIRVNALAPGWVLTDRQKEKWVTESALSAHLARQCLPDTLDPQDIVGGCLFLASDASRMMTGQALVIDGGVVGTG